MILKDGHGNDIIPYAVISGSQAKNGGILICRHAAIGGAGRMGHTVEYLNQHNDPALVKGIINNLENKFFRWCDEQQEKHAEYRNEFRLERGDIVPIDVSIEHDYPSCLITEPDQRNPEEYLSVGEKESRIYHREQQKDPCGGVRCQDCHIGGCEKK